MWDGTTGDILIASRDTTGVAPSVLAYTPTITSDGRCVVFGITAPNMVSPPIASAVQQIYLNVLAWSVVGDVNGDRVVSNLDLQEIIREWRTQTHNPYASHAGTGGETINADVDGDGDLDRGDVSLLLQHLLPSGL